jgi:hypothetical protein
MTESNQPVGKKKSDTVSNFGCIVAIVVVIAIFLLFTVVIAPYDPNASDPYRYDPLADPDIYPDPIGY